MPLVDNSMIRFNNFGTNLTLLIEEACEVAQVACKIKRFGLGSYHPNKGRGFTNRAELQREIGDFLAIVDILTTQGILDKKTLTEAKAKKMIKLEDWYETDYGR